MQVLRIALYLVVPSLISSSEFIMEHCVHGRQSEPDHGGGGGGGETPTLFFFRPQNFIVSRHSSRSLRVGVLHLWFITRPLLTMQKNKKKGPHSCRRKAHMKNGSSFQWIISTWPQKREWGGGDTFDIMSPPFKIRGGGGEDVSPCPPIDAHDKCSHNKKKYTEITTGCFRYYPDSLFCP